jgi:hypothetical protein
MVRIKYRPKIDLVIWIDTFFQEELNKVVAQGAYGMVRISGIAPK